MNARQWRIGEVVARATGLSVRTLRYYEDEGLVTPSGRLPSGHRVYSTDDVRRLYRVCVLRRLGRPVAAIPALLDQPDTDLSDTIDAHLSDLDERLASLGRERDRVLAARRTLAEGPLDDLELRDLLDGIGDADAGAVQRITLLVYDDIPAAHDFLVNVFGFSPGGVKFDDDGRVVHGEVHVGDGVIWLHRVAPEHHLASPRDLGATTHCMAVLVDDVDRHAARARALGAAIVSGPVDQPYGYREYSALDCEGGLWSFMQPQEHMQPQEPTQSQEHDPHDHPKEQP